jgi:hypothetical protein
MAIALLSVSTDSAAVEVRVGTGRNSAAPRKSFIMMAVGGLLMTSCQQSAAPFRQRRLIAQVPYRLAPRHSPAARPGPAGPAPALPGPGAGARPRKARRGAGSFEFGKNECMAFIDAGSKQFYFNGRVRRNRLRLSPGGRAPGPAGPGGPAAAGPALRGAAFKHDPK